MGVSSNEAAREPAIVAACDVAHNTALHVAAWAGNLSMCAALLEAMAAVSATDLAGNTPLHHS
ncbi:MAG: ankyrin repeat domain-containing protein, partial [Betaproteobacteria bacterium]